MLVIPTNTWVDDLIDALTNVLAVGGTISIGPEIAIKVTQEIVDLIVTNKSHLELIAVETYKQFLDLFIKQRTFDALVVVYSELNNADLTKQFNSDSNSIADLVAASDDEEAFWVSFAEQLSIKTATIILTILI